MMHIGFATIIYALGFLSAYIVFSIIGRRWVKRSLLKKGSKAAPGQNSKSDVAEKVIAVIRR